MEQEKQPSTFYKDMIPKLIKKYKHLVDQCFEIVDQSIDPDLSADKRHAELRSKRDAMADAQHYAKEIDNLENILNGVEPTLEEDNPEANNSTNWAKRRAKKPA
jgi:hypothetical protein